MSVIPDGFGEATLNLDFVFGPSNPMAIVFGYDFLGSPGPSAHASSIRGFFETVMGNTIGLTNNLLLVSVTTLENPGGVSGVSSSGFVGNDTSAAMPPQVAVLIRKTSNTGGRRGRGRMYVPGLAQSASLEGGYLVAATQANWQQRFDTFLSSLAAADLPMVILHNDIAFIPSGVTTLSVQNILATQRRRIRG